MVQTSNKLSLLNNVCASKTIYLVYDLSFGKIEMSDWRTGMQYSMLSRREFTLWHLTLVEGKCDLKAVQEDSETTYSTM